MIKMTVLCIFPCRFFSFLVKNGSWKSPCAKIPKGRARAIFRFFGRKMVIFRHFDPFLTLRKLIENRRFLGSNFHHFFKNFSCFKIFRFFKNFSIFSKIFHFFQIFHDFSKIFRFFKNFSIFSNLNSTRLYPQLHWW